MIELLERQDIFKLNETFSSFIADVQDAKYNPTLDYNKYEPCEMYVDDSEELSFPLNSITRDKLQACRAFL